MCLIEIKFMSQKKFDTRRQVKKHSKLSQLMLATDKFPVPYILLRELLIVSFDPFIYLFLTRLPLSTHFYKEYFITVVITLYLTPVKQNLCWKYVECLYIYFVCAIYQ